jgi:hypothetical protein
MEEVERGQVVAVLEEEEVLRLCQVDQLVEAAVLHGKTT